MVGEGCTNFCAYCIIPHVRGAIRSKPPDNCVSELHTLADAGFNEVYISAIHLGSYGKDLGSDLPTLLEKMAKACPGVKLRLGSLEPNTVNQHFLSVMKNNKNICRHFHLSLQSGCDETLKSMRRHYTSADYKNAVADIRSIMPNCAITTDILVGFPGESEADFEKSAAFVKSIGFAHSHIFPFSVRKGTFAETMDSKLSKKEKDLRVKLMSEICEKSKKDFLSRFLGKKVSVLFETYKSDFNEGLTDNYITVRVKSEANLQNRIAEVLITAVCDGFCEGIIDCVISAP